MRVVDRKLAVLDLLIYEPTSLGFLVKFIHIYASSLYKIYV